MYIIIRSGEKIWIHVLVEALWLAFYELPSYKDTTAVNHHLFQGSNVKTSDQKKSWITHEARENSRQTLNFAFR